MRFLISLCLFALTDLFGCSGSKFCFGDISSELNDHHISYLSWDNTSIATPDELAADPLLIIRTIPSDCSPEISGQSKTLASKGKRKRPSKIVIQNTENHFDFTTPVFILHAPFPCQKIRWQIANDPEFTNIPVSLDQTADYFETITLSDIQNTFLDIGNTYYFRVTCIEGQFKNSWSAPFPFTVSKPSPIQNLRIQCDPDQLPLKPALVWDANESPDAIYMIFGSANPDFIPTLNSRSLIDPFAVIESDEEDNFLSESSLNSFFVDERLGYYRVVTKINDSLSKPSPLIKFDGAIQFDPQSSEECRLFENMTDLALSKAFSFNKTEKYTPYIQPPSLPSVIWNELTPYFLPENTPQKALLDEIFTKRRVLSSLKSMSRAGFILLTDPKHKIIVARHPKIPGYLFKVFLDTSSECDYHWWRKRINGVNAIQAAIDSHGYNHIMKTPKKWMYPLPPEPLAAEGSYPKNFILVVEEVDIFKQSENRSAYRTMMTKERLNAFYTLLKDLNLIDSVYADNTPFCKDGKMAFIDTEHAMDLTLQVPLSVVGQYLNPEMLKYWEQLISNGIPQ